MNSQDHEKWEMNRMVNSGALKLRNTTDASNIDEMENEESRVMLLVHDLKPPFLDGRETYTR